MTAVIKNNIDRIIEACKKHHVKSLYLFGSAATGKIKSGSDLDFLIDYNKDRDGLPVLEFDYFDFLFILEEITGQKVDLVVADAIRNKYFRERVEKEKMLLYAE
jgi:predicted nucleotidyltransferase